MDAISLATLTSALTVLGSEVGKGVASEAGKDLWAKVKRLLGWASEPAPMDLAVSLATQLQRDEILGAKVVALLKGADPAKVSAAALIGKIKADKVVVVQHMEVSGDFQM